MAVWVTILTVAVSSYLCSGNPYFTLIMAPKCKSYDAGNLDMPKGSHKMLPLSEKDMCACIKHTQYVEGLVLFAVSDWRS